MKQQANKHKNTEQQLVVQGGTPLTGVVRLGGAKNASYKLMIAAIMADSKSRILNLPDIADVKRVATIIQELGGETWQAGPKTLFIDPTELQDWRINLKHGQASRASTLFAGPLLAKFGKAKLPLPGGDKIGKRPLGRHLAGLEQLGVKWQFKNDFLYLETDGLCGTNYRFVKNTHTGTETLLMAATMAQGKTVLENAAQEPEIDDLIEFLNKMGARIRRRAFRVLEIEGVPQLHGDIHKVMPDRNEAVSYACGAIATQGDIVIENAQHQHLTAFLDKLQEAGGGCEIGHYGIRFYYQGKLRATDVTTKIHPGFMTDWQPLWATLICHAQGDSIIHETVMQNRFQYIDHLQQMGAKISVIQPKVQDPDKTYNFNWADKKETDIHAIKIHGPTQFNGDNFTVHDLRAGATILLAAISGQGETRLSNIEQIDRGYENIEQKLTSLGADIKRVAN
jgi:UDP-N-acetylglucosamine 1-carboxyvinyltransferase